MRTLLFVAAILFALLAAVFDFGWLTDPDTATHPLGLLALGFACFVGGHLTD